MSKFTTAIDANGPNGNILAVLGTATDLMRQLGVDPNEITELRRRVMMCHSYCDALAAIRKWFLVEIKK